METVILLYGGISTEHEVSCLSAANIYGILNDLGYVIIPIGITRTGRFYLQPVSTLNAHSFPIQESPEHEVFIHPGIGLIFHHAPLEADVILPVTHGTYGEDGILQGLLSTIPYPFIGSTHEASMLGMRKSLTKRLLSHHIPMTPYGLYDDAHQEDAVMALQEFGLPLVVKPDCGGSSVGVTVVRDDDELQPAISEALKYDAKVLIEPCIDAREIECGVFGSSHILITVPGEVKPTDRFYSYEEKYLDPDLEYTIPADITRETFQMIREFSEEAYRTLGCSGFARVDFFIDRKSGELYLNEINTIPGLTKTSLFPKLLEVSGFHYREFFRILIDDALSDYDRRHRLRIDIPGTGMFDGE